MGVTLTYTDILNILYGLICWAERLGALLAVLFIIIAGIRIMAAGSVVIGEDKKATGGLTGAKEMIKWVLIGLVVMLMVNAIISVVASTIGVDFSPIPLVCSKN